MSDSLTTDQAREVQQIAELETRRYFDHYLKDVWPIQQKALREHTHICVETHDTAKEAHGGVERRFARLLWMLIGVATAGGVGGVGFTKLRGLVGG